MEVQFRTYGMVLALILLDINVYKGLVNSLSPFRTSTKSNNVIENKIKEDANGSDRKEITTLIDKALNGLDKERDDESTAEHPLLRPLICTFVPSIPECFFFSTMKSPTVPMELEPKNNPNSSTVAYYEEKDPENAENDTQAKEDVYRLKHVIKMLCRTVLNILRT